MNEREQIIEIARREIRLQNLGITQQVLEVHRIVEAEAGPKVAGVLEGKDPAWAHVYFAIEDELYFFKIDVQTSPVPRVLSADVEARANVYFSAPSQVLDPDEISELIGLEPTRSWRKGTPLYNSGRLRPISVWIYEPQHAMPGRVERKLPFLLDRLEPRHDGIVAAARECTCSICIAYHGHSAAMGGWELDSATIRRLVRLDLPLGVDLYACGSELPE
ncbi:MAG TPA: DUF4279 domain-containing protein [Phycisphaerae bacterium]|nr:DUF4279 domain-containing protein [Phycisphaerae bacterium]